MLNLHIVQCDHSLGCHCSTMSHNGTWEPTANSVHPASKNRWAGFDFKKAKTSFLSIKSCIQLTQNKEIKLFSCYCDKDLSKTAWLEGFLTPAPKLNACASLNNLATCNDKRMPWGFKYSKALSEVKIISISLQSRKTLSLVHRHTHTHTPSQNTRMWEFRAYNFPDGGNSWLHPSPKNRRTNFLHPVCPRVTIHLQLLASSRRFPSRGPPGATICGF